jgi:hypothetical protein
MSELRRRSDGSPDIDFYHASLSATRRQHIRDSTVLRRFCSGLLILVAIFSLALIIASPGPAPRGVAGRAEPSASQLW